MEAEVTILKLKDTLIVPVQVELHDNAAKALQEKILMSIEKENAQGLIIDISGIFIVDSFLGRILAETAKMAKLIGAKVVLTGMRKEV
ncbi:MAG: STAS domain-containing protein, partial [Leptospiraceae bacterium]|nr:STAS domain-containing protein [Leptospiraceae bacterium]